ncbi:MAG TPA: hypothetical protein VGQ83_37270 [Polyangia bacterium]|jgi:hypothetical protein
MALASRYPMRLDRLWRLPLLVVGATPARARVEVDRDGLIFHFGLFRLTVPLGNVAGATRSTWSILHGIGIRVSFGGTLGLIGSTAGVAAVHLKEPQLVRLLVFQVRCSHIVVSLEDPDAFVRDLEQRAGA